MLEGVLNPIKIKPGEFITGRFALWEDYHQLHLRERKPRRKPAPSAITVRRWLLTLQDRQILNIKSHNKYSIISICNWKQYQQNEQQVNNRRTTDDHIQEDIYKGRFFSVKKERYQTFQEAYPGIDIMAEFRKMDAWLESNPGKRKTAIGYPRFVNNWLSKAFKSKAEGSKSFWDELPNL